MNSYFIREVGTGAVLGYASSAGGKYVGRTIQDGDPTDAPRALEHMRNGNPDLQETRVFIALRGMSAEELVGRYLPKQVELEYIGVL